MKLSIIVPVYNEINCLERFTNNLIKIFHNQNVEYIFVNDGSTDGSTEWLVNYNGGFTRRGLGGEIAIMVANLFDFSLRQSTTV